MTGVNATGTDVQLVVADGVATVTLARARTRNAIDTPFSTEICARVQEAAGRADVGVILVRADGPAWCVGGAIDNFLEVGDGMHAYMLELGESINALVTTLHECDKITIAAVHGAVGGGGVGIMLAHDVVLAEEGTVFALGYSRIGTSPDGGNSYFMTRDLGYRRALELYLLNERIDAGRASRARAGESRDAARRARRSRRGAREPARGRTVARPGGGQAPAAPGGRRVARPPAGGRGPDVCRQHAARPISPRG